MEFQWISTTTEVFVISDIRYERIRYIRILLHYPTVTSRKRLFSDAKIRPVLFLRQACTLHSTNTFIVIVV